MDLQVTTEFLLIASILVELKSKKLLPGPDEVEPDDELCGFEQRDRLLGRLLELQAYSAAADAFAVLVERAARCVPRTAGLEEHFRSVAPDLLAGVTPAMLAAAYGRATATKEAPIVDLHHVTVEAVTVSEAVAELLERLPAESRTTFRQLTASCTTRMQVIVRFLALLELCKQGRVVLDQGHTFGDVQVTWTGGAQSRRAVGAVAGMSDEPGMEEYDG